MDEIVISDLCYVTGIRHYDDSDQHDTLYVRNHIKRARAHMLKSAMDGYSMPIESFLNLDY